MLLTKKSLAPVLLASMLTLAACGNGEDTTENGTDTGNGNANGTGETTESVEVATEGFPIVDDTLTLSLMAPGLGLAEWQDMPTLQEYSDRTNIEFDFTTPPQGDFATRLNLAFASQELPDIIYAGGPNTLNASAEVDYGSQGLLLPLEDMLEEYAPNFYALMEESPEIRQSITTTDGHIYALPRIDRGDTAPWIMGPVWYNGEWLDALGVEELPQTTEEFYDLMVRFRDEDPNGNGQQDEIPISDINMNGLRGWMMPAFGIKGWGIEEHNGEARYTFATDNFRAYLEYMHRFYSEGLLDQETFSQSNEQKAAKGENNQIGVFQDWFSYFTLGGSEEEAVNNPMYAPLTSEWQEEPLMPLDVGIARGVFALTSENQNPEASLRWIDYFYTEEGYEFLNLGPEGYLWEWEDEEGGARVFNEDIAPEEREEYRGSITPAYGITVPGLAVEMDPIGGERSEFSDFLLEETEEKIVAHGEAIFPLVYLTPEEQEEVNDIKSELETYVVENEAAFITGNIELNDENWNNYMSTMENLGVRRFEEIHQAAYDRWVEAGENN